MNTKQTHLHRFITQTSNDFICATIDNVDVVIQSSIAGLGKIFHASRSALFILSDDKAYASNSHEWLPENRKSQKEDLIDINLEMYKDWCSILKMPEIIYINKNKDYNCLKNNKNYFFGLEEANIILSLPIRFNDELFGFIVLDNPSINEIPSAFDQELFIHLGSLYGSILFRLQSELDKVITSNRYEKSIQAIDHFAIKLLEATEENEIYEIFAREIKRVVGSAFITVNEFDEKQNRVITRAFAGIDSFLLGLLKRLGLKLEGSMYPLEKGSFYYNKIIEKKITLVEGGIYELAFGSIPKVICRQIEKVVNISEVYACGLVGGKDLLGTFSIIMIGEKLKRKTEVEMLSKIFSGSLRRFKSQQALISSEKKYHQLVNTMNEGIMGRDNEGIIKYVNTSFCTITGFNEEELLGLPLESLLPTEESKIWLRNRYTNEISEKSSTFEIQVQKKNGQTIWLEVSASPWRNDNGELIGVLSVNTDITQRKQIEKKLQEAQKHLKQAAELAKIIPWKYDIANETINFSDTLKDTPFLKKNSSFSISKLIDDLVQPSYKSHISGIIDLCKKNINNHDFKIEFECHAILPGGIDKVFYIKGNAAENGWLSGMVQDVTDLREAKETAFYTEWKFKDLMHQSSDGIILMDKSGKVLEWNRQMERMTGKSADEVTDTCIWEIKDLKNFESIISEPFYDAIYESLVSNKDELEYSFGEFEMLFPTMEKHTMAYSAFPVFSVKEALICVIIKDITKIKDQYELQKQLDVAHQTTEIRQQFLANMGHEMRTPLNGLIGMLELLKTTRLTQTQIEFLDIASKSSDSLLYLINNILELSRMEIGVIKITASIFPVNEMLQRMVQLFKPSAIEKNIKIEMLLNPANINYIESDEIKISQILSNLLSNAIKFTNEKGHVSINALLIEETKQKGRLIISVRDTGIGISEDQQHLLFKEFSQVDNTNTRKYDGAGLGLAISRQLTELLGGKIWVESKEGEGSNFSFEIPVGLIKEKSKKNLSPAFDIKLKALIVESRLLHQKLLGIMLQNRDIDVYIAANAIQAIELFNEFTPNMVFIDSSLPDIEASDLIDKMKTAQKSNNTDYILLASDFDQDADAKLFNSFGFYLQKPIKEQDLSSILKQIKTKYDIL